MNYFKFNKNKSCSAVAGGMYQDNLAKRAVRSPFGLLSKKITLFAILLIAVICACFIALPNTAFAWAQGSDTDNTGIDEPILSDLDKQIDPMSEIFGSIGAFFDSVNPINNVANIEDGYYRIKSSVNNSYVIDAAGAGFSRGTNIQLYQNNNSDAQLWKVINQDDGYILIVNANSGLVLDVTGAVAANGTNVQSYFTNHTNSQLWKPTSIDGKIVLVSKLNANYVLDLSNGVAQNWQNIQIYSRNDSAAQKWVFTKTDAPALEVPALQFSLNGTTLDKINSGDKDIEYEGNSLTIEEQGASPVAYDNVRIKGRGNSTWNAPKKPYNIKFSEAQDLFGMGSAKKWVLLANYFDVSNIRTDTAAYIAKEIMGMDKAWSGQFVNLYMDNEYVGLYYLTHKIEFGESTVPFPSEEEKGVICEEDGYAPEYYHGYAQYSKSQISIKDKQGYGTSEQEGWNAIEDFMATWNTFEKGIYEKNWDTAKSAIDLDSFTKMVLFIEFTYNGDGFANSEYFYKFGSGTEKKMYAGPPWDFDHAFFSDPWAINDPYMSIAYHNGQKRGDGRLLELPEFRALVEAEYQRIAAQGKLSTIVQRIQSVINTISNQAKKDNSKWLHTNIVNGVDCSHFQDDVNYVVDGINKHLQMIDVLYGHPKDLADGIYTFTDQSGNKLNNIYVQKQADGYYHLISTDNGKAICVVNGSLQNNAPCAYMDYQEGDAYEWKFSEYNGKLYILTKNNALVLDTNQGLHQSDMVGSNTQLFDYMTISFDSVFDTTVATGTQYDLVSAISGNLDMSASGTNIQTGQAQTSNSAVFAFSKNADNTCTLTEPNSNLAVDVANNSRSNGANIQLSQPSESQAQKWFLRKNADGTRTLINPYSWKTIDVAGGSSSTGTNIQLWEINNSAAQRWSFQAGVKQQVLDLALANKGTVTAGTYKICQSKNQNYVLDVSGGSHDNCANVQLYVSNNTNAQKWQVTEDTEGFLTIKNIGSGKVLDVAGANIADFTNVWQYSSNNSYAQKWIAVKDGNNIKLVSALNPNKVLDLSGGIVANFSNIQLYSSNDTQAQRWVFVKL